MLIASFGVEKGRECTLEHLSCWHVDTELHDWWTLCLHLTIPQVVICCAALLSGGRVCAYLCVSLIRFDIVFKEVGLLTTIIVLTS